MIDAVGTRFGQDLEGEKRSAEMDIQYLSWAMCELF